LSDEERWVIITFNSSLEGGAACVELVGKGSPVDCTTALNEGTKGPPCEPAINDMITRTRTITKLFLDKIIFITNR
jgi:hypothetical protein